MSGGRRGASTELETRVERVLHRCLEYSQLGRHRKVLNEVEALLPLVDGQPALEAQVLIWKAQALLTMGCPERALPAAQRSWELETSPHACHLMASALASMGEADDAEDLLRAGADLFRSAVHLPVQLAMLLTDQGRLPEALDMLEGLPPLDGIPDDLEVFVLGLRSNILATMGRWREADGILSDGIGLYPESDILREARSSLGKAWSRERAERALVSSWEAELDAAGGVTDEVDEAVVRHALILEAPTLVCLAARRLWRSFVSHTPIRPQAPEAWATAMLAAIWELDGNTPSVAALARATRCVPSTVRGALTRVRTYIEGLDPGLAGRAFAAFGNPRLTAPSDRPAPNADSHGATVVPFPKR